MMIGTGEFVTDDEMPRARMASLLNHFSHLDDERDPGRVAYPLSEVLLIVTCATIATCDDFDDIVAWGEHHLDFLRRFVSAFLARVVCVRWPTVLIRRCFEDWIKAFWPGRHDLIAIDGKTSRRSHDKAKVACTIGGSHYPDQLSSVLISKILEEVPDL